MMSVLFIGTRVRAIAVTKGDPKYYGLPQWWCKDAMAVSACAVFALAICSIMEKLTPSAATAFTFIQYAADADLYAGCAVVAFGLHSTDTPPVLGASTPISDTAKCVMYLTFFYFPVAILHQFGVSYDLLTGRSGGAASTESSSLTGGGEKKTKGGAFTSTMHHWTTPCMRWHSLRSCASSSSPRGCARCSSATLTRSRGPFTSSSAPRTHSWCTRC